MICSRCHNVLKEIVRYNGDDILFSRSYCPHCDFTKSESPAFKFPMGNRKQSSSLKIVAVNIRELVNRR